MSTSPNTIEMVIWLTDCDGNIVNRSTIRVNRNRWENADDFEREEVVEDGFDELREDFYDSLTQY